MMCWMRQPLISRTPDRTAAPLSWRTVPEVLFGTLAGDRAFPAAGALSLGG